MIRMVCDDNGEDDNVDDGGNDIVMMITTIKMMGVSSNYDCHVRPNETTPQLWELTPPWLTVPFCLSVPMGMAFTETFCATGALQSQTCSLSCAGCVGTGLVR